MYKHLPFQLITLFHSSAPKLTLKIRQQYSQNILIPPPTFYTKSIPTKSVPLINGFSRALGNPPRTTNRKYSV